MFKKTKSNFNLHKDAHNQNENISREERYDVEFKQLELLHDGTFSKTYRCLNKVNEIEYAIKQSKDNADNSCKEVLIREGKILCSLQRHGCVCNHIVSYLEMWTTDDSCFVITELCKDNLLSFLINRKEKIDEDLLIKIILHISRALSFLHSKKFIHFNVNPSNILVSETGRFKLTDFKLSRYFSSCDDKENISKIVQLNEYKDAETKYLCNEIVKEQINFACLDKTDIFALGCVIFEIVASEDLPIWKKDNNAMNVYWNEIRNGLVVVQTLNEKGDGLSNNLKQLISKMMSVDPNQRPNADQLVQMLNPFENELLKEANAEVMRLKKELQRLIDDQQKRRLSASRSSARKPVARRARSSSIYNPNR